jgi:hypothetical protein
MKSRYVFRIVAVLGSALCSVPALRADAVSFNLLPLSGNVSGPPGSLVGWGYSLTNDSTADWFMSTSLNADSFLNGTPTSLFDFPILGPGDTSPEPFDPVNNVGLYELQWDASAPAKFVNSGNFVLSGEWWNGDPLNGGTFIADAPDISLPYSATVAGMRITPEPSSFLVLACGMGILLVLMFKRSRQSRDARKTEVPR